MTKKIIIKVQPLVLYWDLTSLFLDSLSCGLLINWCVPCVDYVFLDIHKQTCFPQYKQRFFTHHYYFFCSMKKLNQYVSSICMGLSFNEVATRWGGTPSAKLLCVGDGS
jgi:hypothetical protein